MFNNYRKWDEIKANKAQEAGSPHCEQNLFGNPARKKDISCGTCQDNIKKDTKKGSC